MASQRKALKRPPKRTTSPGHTTRSVRPPPIAYAVGDRAGSWGSLTKKEQDLELISAHEAGHVIAAVLHGVPFLHADVQGGPDDKIGRFASVGGVRVVTGLQIKSPARAASLMLAGIVGSEVYLFTKFGVASAGLAERDLWKALPGGESDVADAAQMVAELIIPPPHNVPMVKRYLQKSFSDTINIFMSKPATVALLNVAEALRVRKRLSRAAVMKILREIPDFPVDGIPG